ncbi:MAG: prepilin peptidase [Bradyrhizobium sp.]|nr:prepilin peptidase [Bradyrhizobium sp.]
MHWLRANRLAIAAVAALGATAVSVYAAPGAAGAMGAGLGVIMLAIAVIDARHFIIPDPLNAAALALGLAQAALMNAQDRWVGLADASLRAAVLAALFLILRAGYARLRGWDGIGLGDVKLAAVAGVWLDWVVMPLAIEIAALSALGAYAIHHLLRRRAMRANARLPFGLFFAPAIWIGWLLQTTWFAHW